MRRIDVLAITFGVFLGGGLLYLILKMLGVAEFNAGLWTQGILVLGLLGWTGTYIGRVFGQKMTLNQQLENYKLAVLQKRYESISPEERAQLEAEVEAERAKQRSSQAQDSES